MDVAGVTNGRHIARAVPRRRTPISSHMTCIFRAAVRPPIALMWQRMKSISRSSTKGLHSWVFTNNSPIAIGVVHCCRTSRNQSTCSGGRRSSRKNSR